MNPESPLADLMARFPHAGRVGWIGVRPERGQAMRAVDEVEADPGFGLSGDRYRGKSGKRHVTLIQAEHLPVMAQLMGWDELDPAVLRRNIVVSGINVIALKKQTFRIGEALLEGTGPCDPCSKMEMSLGEGFYNIMRGHGGLTARVLEAGTIRIGDAVRFVPADA